MCAPQSVMCAPQSVIASYEPAQEHLQSAKQFGSRSGSTF